MMFEEGSLLVAARLVCFLAGVSVCVLFFQYLVDALLDLHREHHLSYAQQAGVGIWITAAGTALYTSHRTAQVFFLNDTSVCAGDRSFYIILGYMLMTLGYFLHILGKSGQTGYWFGGLILCGIISLLGVGALALAAHVGCH